jgi:hypothetical protein
MSNLLSDILLIKRILENISITKLNSGSYPTDPVVDFIENVFRPVSYNAKKMIWHSVINKGTPKIFTALQSFKFLYLLPNSYDYVNYITFNSISYKLSYENNEYVYSLILNIDTVHVYNHSSFEFMMKFYNYIIHLLIVNRIFITLRKFILNVEIDLLMGLDWISGGAQIFYLNNYYTTYINVTIL